ncbi:MAG: DUF6790 family protein [Thermoleophilia bacterium]|jgi:hypothetical protein
MLYVILVLQILVIAFGVGIHMMRNRDDRTGAGFFKVFLPWFLAVSIGLGGVWSFMGHAFFADETAKSIGWPIGNPFQFEVAIANLSYGVLGFLCLRYHGKFWWATVIAYTVFLWGAAYGHIYELLVNNNHEPGNAGFVLYADIITPVLLIALLIAYSKVAGKEPATG